MNINFERLHFYVYKKLIKRSESKRILSECEKLDTGIRDYVVTKGILTEREELPAAGAYYCMPHCDVDLLDIDEELFNLFTYEFMKKHKVIPVCRNESGVVIFAVSRPMDCCALSSIASCLDGEFDFILVPPGQIDRYIDSVAAVISTSSVVSDLNSEKDKEVFSDREIYPTGPSISDEVINNPAVRLVDSIIREAIPYRASDIHIEPHEKTVRVRYRIDGSLQNRAEFPIESYSAICARIKIMSGMNIAERRLPQDGRINMTIGGSEYDFRISSIPTVYGEKFVIRILDKSSFHFDRSNLGFSPEENLLVDKMLRRPHGIILLTGPTGCGKSTTLYSFLRELNTPQVNVITVEDPVEYTLNGVNQTQVNSKINMTFATALRSILRQDPDIIMVGEIRDEETAEIAVRSAITGHLVLSTLHTNDAPGAVTRLEDMGIPDYLVADALVGVIAQRLVKRLCPACKKRSRTNPKEMEILKLDEPIPIYRPRGCQYCNNTGYKGRAAVHEIMYFTEKMRSIVTAEKNVEVIRNEAKNGGMVTLWESCYDLVVKGVTSMQELMTLRVE